MKMKINNLIKEYGILLILLAVFLFKGIFLTILSPIYQGPDEPVHYATVQLFAEPKEKDWALIDNSHTKIDTDNILTFGFSEEIHQSAVLSDFDKVTFNNLNTQFFITNSTLGQSEKQISQSSFKKYNPFIQKNTSGGSPIYYSILLPIEKIFSSSSIFTRFFLIRLASVILGLLAVLFTFLITREIGFSKSNSILISAIIAFQPMFSYMTSVINPDSTLIFFFTVFSYLAVKILKNGFNIKNTILILITIYLAIFTKLPAIIFIPLIVILVAYRLYLKIPQKRKKDFLKKFIAITTVSIFLFFIYSQNNAKNNLNAKFTSTNHALSSFISDTLNKDSLQATYSQYWGNFGWLDTPTPRNIINIILILEIIGLFGIIWFVLSKKKINSLPDKIYILYLILIILSLKFIIHYAQWQVFNRVGEDSLGAPGRYFLPTISAHIIIISSGFYFIIDRMILLLNNLKSNKVSVCPMKNILCKQINKHNINLRQISLTSILKTFAILSIILQLYAIFDLIIIRYYL